MRPMRALGQSDRSDASASSPCGEDKREVTGAVARRSLPLSIGGGRTQKAKGGRHRARMPSLQPQSIRLMHRYFRPRDGSRLHLFPLARWQGSHGRVGDWRAGLSRSLCSPVCSPFRLRVSQHLDHAKFPASATSNAACGFPALRSPVCFTPRVMGPILPTRLSANMPNPVAVEQLQVFVQPLPTPPHPAEALSFPTPRAAFALRKRARPSDPLFFEATLRSLLLRPGDS
jgi:hypothetical protein